MRWMRWLNLFFVFLIAPIIGIYVLCADFDKQVFALELRVEGVNAALENAEKEIISLQQDVGFVHKTLVEQEKMYREQQELLQKLAREAFEKAKESEQVYEQRILKKLGTPIAVHRSNRVEVKVFKLDELGYRGFIAKVKLFDPSAFRVVLAKDKLGEAETPLEAAKRTGAVLCVNGGGFYSFIQDGKKYTLPIANTVIDGKLINGFHPPVGPNEDVFLAGITRDGELVGRIFYTEDEVYESGIWHGVSFVPILIQNGMPLELPEKWQNTRHPRTIIGEYANGDLILIVVDGRQEDWSIGVTLERLQIKLIELGVKEAYNLDGGGSSTFIFGGEVLNRPSDGKQRKMATSIVILP